MILAHITMTGKGFNPKDTFSIFGNDTKRFSDMKSAMGWIKETYGKSKRNPMYVDTPEGKKKVGYVIGFRNEDLSHSPVKKWIQQDWISFEETKRIYL